MVRQEERAVGGDGRESNFNEMIVGSSGEQKRSKSDGRAAKNAAADCLQKHCGDFKRRELLT